MSLNANALTTVARQKSFLNISSSSNDSRLELLINSVSNYIEKVTGRKFERQTFTNEMYDGKDSQHLYLRNFPIISSTTVTLERRSSALNENDWEGVDASDFFIKHSEGRLTLVSINSFATGVIGLFDCGTLNWRVTYTAGYYLPSDASFGDNYEDDLPSDLELIVWEMVGAVFNASKVQGVSRSKVRDIEVEYGKVLAEDPILKQTLAQYRRRVYA